MMERYPDLRSNPSPNPSPNPHPNPNPNPNPSPDLYPNQVTPNIMARGLISAWLQEHPQH